SAQEGTIAGIVNDAEGRALAGTAVRLESRDGKVLRRTNTDGNGLFVFADVAPGAYAVFAEREGFAIATATGTVANAEVWQVTLPPPSLEPLPPVVVTAPRVEDPRVLTTPRSIGAPVYEITDQAIKIQPGGENNSLNRVLLQAPGVTQDASSVGGIHV